MLGRSIIRIVGSQIDPLQEEPPQTIIIKRCTNMADNYDDDVNVDDLNDEDIESLLKDIEETPDDDAEYLGDEDIDDEDVNLDDADLESDDDEEDI